MIREMMIVEIITRKPFEGDRRNMECFKIPTIFPLKKENYYGNNKRGIYTIRPSAEFPGYFWVENCKFGIPPETIAYFINRPMSEVGVLTWLRTEAGCENINWKTEERNGKEYTPYVKPKREMSTVVYFIKAVGTKFVKIGRGKGRIEGFRVGCPFKLQLLHEIECTDNGLEKQLHDQFKKDCYRGEWFYLSNDIIKYILADTIKVALRDGVSKIQIKRIIGEFLEGNRGCG